MTYPRYLYISFYFYSEGWYLSPIDSCTIDEMINMVNLSIAVDYYPDTLPGDEDTPTDVGYVSACVGDH